MRANRDARRAYAEMVVHPNFVAAERWDAVDASAYDGLLLPGGHRARGMRDYLESVTLQNLVVGFFEDAETGGGNLPWRAAGGAQCLETDGALGAPRIPDDRADLGIRKQRLVGRALHAVLGSQLLPDLSGAGRAAEGLYVGAAGSHARAGASRRLPRCAHGRSALCRKTSGLARDSMADETPAFVVRDRNYVSARWPGDIHTFAKMFSAMLKQPKHDDAGLMILYRLMLLRSRA